MKTVHRIVYTDAYIAEAQRLSIAQSKRLRFLYQSWWSWWPPRVLLIGFVVYLVLNHFDWSISAWLVGFLILHAFVEWAARRRLVKLRKSVRSDDPFTVSMDENGVEVVGKDSHSHSKWSAWLAPVIYPMAF